jgi:flagellar assembly protein FliH
LEEAREQGSGDALALDALALRDKLHQFEHRAATERRDSLEAGRRQGDQEARAELLPVMERLNASIAGITAMRPDLRRRAERDVVQLALMIAKRVLHRQLSVDEGALTAIARVAFERLTRSESYTVTVHPRFAVSIASALPGNQMSRVHIEPDPNCDPGTLIIHSAEGVIDASIDVQLEEISRGLADRLAGA